MVEKEIAARFIAYNLIRGSIASAAREYGVIPRDVSFKAASQLLSVVQTQLYNSAKSFIKNTYSLLLKAMASSLIGQRKRLPQPRVVKRRPKAYPVMTKPRSEYYEELRTGFCTS